MGGIHVVESSRSAAMVGGSYYTSLPNPPRLAQVGGLRLQSGRSRKEQGIKNNC